MTLDGHSTSRVETRERVSTRIMIPNAFVGLRLFARQLCAWAKRRLDPHATEGTSRVQRAAASQSASEKMARVVLGLVRRCFAWMVPLRSPVWGLDVRGVKPQLDSAALLTPVHSVWLDSCLILDRRCRCRPCGLGAVGGRWRGGVKPTPLRSGAKPSVDTPGTTVAL